MPTYLYLKDEYYCAQVPLPLQSKQYEQFCFVIF